MLQGADLAMHRTLLVWRARLAEGMNLQGEVVCVCGR